MYIEKQYGLRRAWDIEKHGYHFQKENKELMFKI